MKITFLISLPRSGSTLLQRMLMAHSRVASHPEPWFLLPLIYMHKRHGICAEYGHHQSVNALDTVLKNLSGGKETYFKALRHFAETLYEWLADDDALLFVDKTPRYYYILPELISVFPEAKFIFLLRNPLSVFASSIEAFRKNSLRRLDHLDRDFYLGPDLIAKGIVVAGARGVVVRYEDLVAYPEQALKQIADFLEIEYEPDMIKKFSEQSLNGHGDHIGARQYTTVHNDKGKWAQMINTSYRKFRLKRFIQGYSPDYLQAGQYSRQAMLNELQSLHIEKTHLAEWRYFLEETVIRNIKRILGRA